ncbi:MAG: hypothetical protein KDD49_05685 [Bacteroidetes bacterium]|nr:hypothetical protein [Bacteroidota bacterium]
MSTGLSLWEAKLSLMRSIEMYAVKAEYIELKSQLYLQQMENGSSAWGFRKKEELDKKYAFKRMRIKARYVVAYEQANVDYRAITKEQAQAEIRQLKEKGYRREMGRYAEREQERSK